MCVHNMCIHATIKIKEEIKNFGDGDTRGVGRIGVILVGFSCIKLSNKNINNNMHAIEMQDC